MTLTIGSLFSIIIVLLVLGILVWLAFYILGQFPLPEPIGKIIQIIVVVIAVLVLVGILLNLAGMGPGIKIGLLGHLLPAVG